MDWRIRRCCIVIVIVAVDFSVGKALCVRATPCNEFICSGLLIC
jgi:hypothetical protein